MTHRRWIVLLIAWTVLVALPVAASATHPGVNGKIAFVRDGDVWAINADGSGRQQITTNPAYDHSPAWSPDGSEIAFTRQQPDGSSAIYVIRPGGESPTRVVGNAYGPTWSPDGRRIAFTRDVVNPSTNTHADTALRVVNRDGTNDRLVLASNVGLFSADWSPDGAELAFNEMYEDSTSLGRVELVDGRVRPIAGIPGREDIVDMFGSPSWAPDGSMILYARTLSSEIACGSGCLDYEIAIVGEDGSGDRRLLARAGTSELGPVFSPDGGSIAFSSGRFGGTFQIWVMDADGTNVRQVTTHPSGGSQPDWQPLPPPAPAPVLSTLSPASVVARAGTLQVTLDGSGFTDTSVVRFNGIARPTTRVSTTRLRVTLAAGDLATPGTALLQVATPAPGGGVSNALSLAITSLDPSTPAPTVLAAPVIHGSSAEGSTLACQVGVWSGATSFAWRWLRDGTPIDGATGPSYVTTALDAGSAVVCRVTASNAGGAGAALTAPIVVVGGTERPAAVAPPVPLPASVGGGATITPRPIIRPARQTARLTRLAGTVRVGQSIRLRLVLGKAVRRLPVTVQRKVGRRWIAIASLRVTGRRPTVKVRARRAGTYVLRLRVGRPPSALVTRPVAVRVRTRIVRRVVARPPAAPTRPARRPVAPAPARAPSPAPATPRCDPNYSGACIPVVSYDLDCGDVAATNFRRVGSDPHRFDGDGDGIACES